MKKLNLFQLCLLSLFILCGVALVFAQISKHPRGITMNIKEVENKYGKQDFESKKFKNGNLKIRASMATSLIQNKVLIGKTNAEIFQLLGYGDRKSVV